MIKAILFDLDGTLIDTNQLIIESFKYTFKNALNKDVSDDDIIKTFGVPLQDTFKNYDENRIEELINIYRKYNKENHDKMCNAFDGIKELIIALRNKNIKVGIVTSKKEDMVLRGLKINELEEYMDVIITPEKTKKHKPDKEPVIKACTDLKISPKEVIMVGDSNYDIIAGNAAGCKTIAVSYTKLDIEEIKKSKPDYFIDKPCEIIDILNDLNNK